MPDTIEQAEGDPMASERVKDVVRRVTRAVRAFRPEGEGATIGERLLYGRAIAEITRELRGLEEFNATAFRAATEGAPPEEEG